MGIADDLKSLTESLTESATKKWTKQRKAEERGKSRYTRGYVYSDRVHFTDVAHKILPEAYMHSSGNGKYTVPKRNLYYASREQFRIRTGREIDYSYFANTLLVKYLNEHPETNSWKITADPRGTLAIPNVHPDYEINIPVGTIQIEEHLKDEKEIIDPLEIDIQMPTRWPSRAAGQRYQGVFYIEKEGFNPMLKEARIAEKFDLAIISCKGHSVVAARRYVDEVCRMLGGVPLFVVHDFDKYGFEIAKSLTEVSHAAWLNDRVTYKFKNKIDVHDLGLRLEDVEKYGLKPERCDLKGDFGNDSICTEEEQQFLRSGRRVELNAFTAPDFISWLEEKLEEHLPERLIPDDNVLEDAYRRAIAVAEINRAIEEARDDAIKKAEQAEIPKMLRREIEDERDGDESWDVTLYRMVKYNLLEGET